LISIIPAKKAQKFKDPFHYVEEKPSVEGEEVPINTDTQAEKVEASSEFKYLLGKEHKKDS